MIKKIIAVSSGVSALLLAGYVSATDPTPYEQAGTVVSNVTDGITGAIMANLPTIFMLAGAVMVVLFGWRLLRKMFGGTK